MKNFLIATLLLFPLALFASIVLPDQDPLAVAMQLFQEWNTLAPLARGAMIIVVLVQGVKKIFPDFAYMRTMVVVGGIVHGFLQSLSSGMSIVDSAVFILITSGGAIAVYELFKSPLNALFGVKKKVKIPA